MEDCVFCKIIAGELPSHRIFEDDRHLAFLSIFPNTDGFAVVTTKEHLPSDAFSNEDAVLQNLIVVTKKVARGLVEAFEDVGRCGMIVEGFGVDHLHFKLVPMHGTASMTEWKPIESKQPQFFHTYPGFLSSQEGTRADDEKLAEFAKQIRALI
ncbi:MAG: hypothetical protein UX04_C0007G0012 [Microgenomates group bacterium GW2011_GWF2_45_18]|nr:MAG: hypothetical protein UX04_C0007G0012 [Microgenomates group bacterium GW2011_GWF2_45_18]OGJ41521.1 MAG: diadenosine tetraphosphate hydrolase [Candidatus Pacebacteria bacterium RIFOXYB1_FULL_44_10]HAU98861.1 diadenosine tetraphosphate hydrolase [Candidatus Paceibacterota bacterium]HAX01181.1 diadenosine tetraphosphate hydrolase [Candidatus Paceibacterota bacterium]